MPFISFIKVIKVAIVSVSYLVKGFVQSVDFLGLATLFSDFITNFWCFNAIIWALVIMYCKNFS